MTLEGCGVFCSNNDRHALLGFRNGQFGAIKTFIFFRHPVKLNTHAVGKLAHRNRNAAGAKIIAPFNHLAYFAAPEQALNFTFCRGIAFLHFRTASSQRLFGMGLRRTGSAAAAVAASSPAYENHYISWLRLLTNNVFLGCRRHHRANFHAFSHKAFVIEFGHLTSSQTNLVAVRAVA